MTGTTPTDAELGDVDLEVADLDRAIAFYRDVLGLRLRARPSSDAAVLAAAGAPRIGLRRGTPARPGHAALVCPDRRALARTLARVMAAGVPITATADHGIGEAVYLRDPDGHGVELHRDRPPSEWPQPWRGAAVTLNRPLDLRQILAQA